MNNFWVFKSKVNFAITVLGVSGVGLAYSSVAKQKVFSSSPVVAQGIKLAGMNPTVRDLLGNPIAYTGSYSNAHHQADNEYYYIFQVKGPKGHTKLEIEAERKPLQQILQCKDNIAKLNVKIEERKVEIEKIEDQIKKGKKSERQEKKQLKSTILLDIQTMKQQKKEEMKKYEENIKKFYIPNQDLFKRVNRGKNPQQLIKSQQEFYQIKALALTLPNRTRISIIPPDQNIKTQTDHRQKIPAFDEPLTEGYFKERLDEGIENMTEAQLESYSKQKTMAMYGKHSNYRVMSIIVLSIAVGLFGLYWHQHRLQPVGGTLIAKEAQLYFMNHSKVKDVIQKLKKNRNNVKWSQTVVGGRKNLNFDCQVDIEGIPGGKVHFIGTRGEKGTNKYSDFTFQYMEEGKVKKVELLI